MPISSLRNHLKRRIQHLSSQISMLDRDIGSSDLHTRVKLAAKLKTLRERKAQLEVRLANLAARSDNALSDIKASLTEGRDDMALALERWFEKY